MKKSNQEIESFFCIYGENWYKFVSFLCSHVKKGYERRKVHLTEWWIGTVNKCDMY